MRNLNIKATLTMLVFGLLAGCATVEGKIEVVRHRASFDFNCPERNLAVIVLDSARFGGTFGVQGCGKRGTYAVVCRTRTMDGCQAILNSPIQ